MSIIETAKSYLPSLPSWVALPENFQSTAYAAAKPIVGLAGVGIVANEVFKLYSGDVKKQDKTRSYALIAAGSSVAVAAVALEINDRGWISQLQSLKGTS